MEPVWTVMEARDGSGQTPWWDPWWAVMDHDAWWPWWPDGDAKPVMDPWCGRDAVMRTPVMRMPEWRRWRLWWESNTQSVTARSSRNGVQGTGILWRRLTSNY